MLSTFDPWRARIDTELRASLRSIVDDRAPAPPRLLDAMEHALLAPGKRLRPLLVLAAGQASLRTRGRLDLQPDDPLWTLCLPAALAIEYVHTYSLVHDDLPGMDDDDLRRGRPTVHVAFDESTAILAGDALLTDAFALVAAAAHHAQAQVKELAVAAGRFGMVAGQYDDMHGAPTSVADLERIHARKTGCLFRAATVLGALAVDGLEHRAALGRYGEKLGLAIQIADDVLDVKADPSRAGKRLGRDEDKVTFVTLLGVDEAERRAALAADEAIDALGAIEAPSLVSLARFAARRDH